MLGRYPKNQQRPFEAGKGLWAHFGASYGTEGRKRPTILDYEPTYGGKIRGKVIEGGEKKKDYEVDPTHFPEELLPSQDKPFRGVLRQPTEGEPFLEEAKEKMPPQSVKAVL
ncbi:hypothetical protein RHMOL_Rhmol07G0181400 [Rhododendron molle]|uniref:Uncharacterized protein n=1 Tax=Rhododendron molle TaxID=49168 RepID=A0ACC0N1S3_RHOML|nr:hypothetical protein RHMOL_Rhmol07G0181400 [Rhododendron molle]